MAFRRSFEVFFKLSNFTVHREKKTETAKYLYSNINVYDAGQQLVRGLNVGCINGLPLLTWSGHTSLCHRARAASETHPPDTQKRTVGPRA
jgi:hypothetical protein